MEEIRHFLRDVSHAGTSVLLTDYEGILAPVSLWSSKPARPHPDLREHLKNLMCSRTRVIVMSSKSADDVARLLAMKPSPEIWGNDGLERIYTDGRYECTDLCIPVELARALADCEGKLDEIGIRNRFEVRMYGLSVSWRGLSPLEKLDTQAKAHSVLQNFVQRHALLRLFPLEEGLELRWIGASKSAAVLKLIDATPGEVPIAYLGHNIVDEEQFRLLNGRGLTVLVRSVQRFSAAQICLRSLNELAGFLRDWGAAGVVRL